MKRLAQLGRWRPAAVWHWLVVVVVLVAVSALWVAASRHGQPLDRATAVGKRAYTRATIAITMATVARTDRDINYCGSHNREQQLDLYLPKHAAATYPLVVFVHGGGWSRGNKTDPIVSLYGPSLVKHGFALASLNYRLAPRYRYPVADQDVGCALSYLYNHAGRYRLNASEFGLFGASAGNQLTTYAALAPASQAAPWHHSVRGIVDFYGVTSLVAPAPHSYLAASVSRFLGPNGASQAVAASPITYAHQLAPPVLIFHGNRDRHVPLAQSQEFAGALTSAGNQAQLVEVNHAGHGFGLRAQPSVGQIGQQITGFFQRVFTTSS